MKLEVENNSDPPAGPCCWVFYRPEWVFIERKLIQKYQYYKLLESLLKTEQKTIKELDLKMDW